MLKNYLRIPLYFLLLCCFAMSAKAQNFGSFSSGVFLDKDGNPTTYNVTGGSGPNAIGPNQPNFTGDLGTFDQNSGTLKLKGSEVQTFKNPGANVCGVTLNYRVYKQGASAPAYTSVDLPFKANCAGGVFDDGLGVCGGNDQKWNKKEDILDLTDRCPGTYVVDVYYTVTGSSNSTSACDQTSTIGNAGAPAGSMTYTITGAAAPVVAGNTTVCPGATTTLTASNCNGTVTWSNGATGATLSAPAGTYTATCTVNGCVSPASDPVTVTETPVAPPAINGDNTVCPGATTTLTASNCNGDVTWSNGATGASIAAPAGTYTATCTVNGCVSPASDPVTVTETPVAPPAINGDNTVCPGATTTLTASNCNGDVTWSNGATGASIAAPAGTYTATCTVNGCVSPASDPVTVTETPVAPPAINGDNTVCPGATTTLTASNCNGDVTWSNGATGASIAAPAGTYTATCTVNGCVSPASDPVTVTETPVAPPAINGDNTVCPGATTTLTASNCNGDVTWSNGATGASIAAPAGTYTATCTVNGCVSPVSDPVTVTETPVAPPAINGDNTVCPGATTTLTASNCNGDVTWSNGATGASIAAPAGTYTATCTVNGCVSPASDPVTVTETPVAPPSINGNNKVCPGATTTLTASNCNGDVSWSNGASGSSITVAAGSYTARCTVNGCVSDVSNNIVVTETPVTVPNISADPTSCPAEKALLTASNCNGTITWSNGATGATLNAAPGSYTATCTIDGCVSDASASVTVKPCPINCPGNNNLLVNGSFENTVIKRPWVPVTQQGWKNEGLDKVIETWRPRHNGAVDGHQIIELNYKHYGIITQDVTVMAGQPITLSYFHKARIKPGERIRVEIVDKTTNQVIHTFESSSKKAWQKFSTSFTPTSDNIQLRLVSLGKVAFSGSGNLVDNVVMNYSKCICPATPDAPVITTTTTDVTNGFATLTASGCPDGTIKWSNGETGTTITTNVPGEYYATCVPPDTSCVPSAPSNRINLTANTDVSVTCPTFEWRTNGVFHITFCVKNNSASPASGTAYFVINGSKEYSDNYSNLASGETKCFTYFRRSLPCGKNVNVTVGTIVLGTDPILANNTCHGAKEMTCVAHPPPYDPNFKLVSPQRSLEGGIFVQDEWLTYTIHCRNDGLGIAHNVTMIDTIDITKLDLSTIQLISSWDSVKLRKIDNSTVAFDFLGVDLTNSSDDMPNSQTEVTFKIKRLPNQPIGTEILNGAGIYFDQEDVVETDDAYSIIIAPCDSADTHPGAVSSDQNIVKGTSPNQPFVLTGYTGIITGWEISTDPAFTQNVVAADNDTSVLTYTNTVDTPTYIRALVQTGDCAIVPSKAAGIYPICGELIKNGSFESPNIGNNNYLFKNVPGWTNLRDGNTMEIHRNSDATDGAQYVELNGNNFGNIYQDFSALPGKTITWSIDHKARIATNEVISITLSAPDGSNAVQATHTGSKTAWQTVTGNYKLAPNQSVVRIKILSSGGTAAEGNYIDRITANYAGCNVTTQMRSSEASAYEGQTTDQPLSISVHPNPVKATAEMKLTGFDNGRVTVEVLNATGQQAKMQGYEYVSGNSISVDLSSLHAGLYLIRVKQGDKMVISKIVKQ